MKLEDHVSGFSLLSAGHQGVLVKRALDPKEQIVISDIPWMLAGLCGEGLRTEAHGLFQTWSPQMTDQEQIVGRFFLAIYECIEGRIESARTLFTLNLKQAKHLKDKQGRFYAYHGMAYLRYHLGRMNLAKIWIARASKVSHELRSIYCSTLALELTGRILMGLGFVQGGLRTLNIAAKKASLFHLKAQMNSIQQTIITQKAIFGLCQHSEELIESLADSQQSNPSSNRYETFLHRLAIVRIRLLQGRLSDASTQLELLSQSVHQLEDSLLYFDYCLLAAEYDYQTGETFLALNRVRAARERAESRGDIYSVLRLSGLEGKILKTRGQHQHFLEVMSRIESLTKIYGGFIGQRILLRASGGFEPPQQPGTDPLGDLIDQVAHSLDSAIPIIVRMGWLSLLRPMLGIKSLQTILYLDLEPNSLTIFAFGEVSHFKDVCFPEIRKFFWLLAEGNVSHEQIVNLLYQKPYKSSRDDELVLGLVARSRRSLGPWSDWIEASKSGFRLRPGLRVLGKESLLHSSDKLEPALEDYARLEVKEGIWEKLNTRQVQIVSWLHAGESVCSSTVVERLQVSDATASRDLSRLVALGLLSRTGKGPATQYFISQTLN